MIDAYVLGPLTCGFQWLNSWRPIRRMHNLEIRCYSKLLSLLALWFTVTANNKSHGISLDFYER